MINCPNCNTQNNLGAIFCRGCGNKLEISNLRPETDKQRQSREGLPWGRAIYRLSVFTLLLAILAVLGGLFLPCPDKPVTALDEAQATEALKKLESINLPMKINETLSFSSAEATAIANRLLIRDDQQGSYQATAMTIRFQAGYAVVTVKGKLLGRLPMQNQCVVKLTSDDKNAITVTVLKTRAGKIPMPKAAWAENLVLSRIQPLFTGTPQLDNARRCLRSAEPLEGELKVQLLPFRERLKKMIGK